MKINGEKLKVQTKHFLSRTYAFTSSMMSKFCFVLVEVGITLSLEKPSIEPYLSHSWHSKSNLTLKVAC